MTLLIGFLSPRRRGIARTGAGMQDTGGLNAASDLNDELLWGFVSGAHPRRDRVGGYDGQPDGGAVLATDASGFTALRSPGWIGSAWYWPAPAITGKEWTWQFRLRLDPPQEQDFDEGVQPKILAIPYRMDVWELPWAYELWMDEIAIGGATGRLHIGYVLDEDTRRSASGPSGLVLFDGQEHTYAVRVRDEGAHGEVDWFRDGDFVSTTSFNGAHGEADLGAAPYLIAFNRHRQALDAGEGLRATIGAAGLWNKALSDAQIELFAGNPWDLVEIAAEPLVPPTIHAWDAYYTLDAGAAARVAPLVNDSGAGLTIVSVTQPNDVHAGTGVAIVGGAGGTETDITIDAAETAESFLFTYTAKDADDNEGTAAVHVTVMPAQLIGENNEFTLAAGETHTVSPLVNDNAPGGSTIESVTQPQGVAAGTSVAIAANETQLQITIDAEEEAEEFTFTYTAKAPDGHEWTQNVTVTVEAATPPPGAYFDTVTGIPNLLAYWRLGEPSGDTITDHSGNGHHGTVVGSVVRGADDLPQEADDAATLFQGEGHIAVPHAAAFALAAVTISGWFTVTALPASGFQPVFGKDASGLNTGDFAAWIEPNGAFAVHVQSASASHQITFPAITLGQTYHWLAILDGTGLRAWLNNVPGTPQTGFTGAWQDNTVELRLGGVHWTSNRHQGVLDEVAIYARALGAAEREALAQRPEQMPPPPPPPPGETCLITTGLTVVDVSTASALTNALASGQTGRHIRLADGTYSGTFTITTNATAASPIVISAVNPHQAVFTGQFRLNGAHTTLSGLGFDPGNVRIEGGNNRVSNCLFRNCTDHAVDVRVGAHYNRIDHNDFRFLWRSGIYCRNVGSQIPPLPSDLTIGTWIHHNFFRSPRPETIHYEEITLHGNNYAQTGMVIEYNLIDGGDDPALTGNDETISIKTGGNTIRGNTQLNRNLHNFKNRLGDNNIWEWNHTRWLVIHGDNHIVRQNIVTNELRIAAGNVNSDSTPIGENRWPLRPGSSTSAGLPAARFCDVRDNQCQNQLRVGAGAGAGYQEVAAAGNVLLRNSGTVSLHNETGTQVTGGSPQIPTHVGALAEADVGPIAYAAKCGSPPPPPPSGLGPGDHAPEMVAEDGVDWTSEASLAGRTIKNANSGNLSSVLAGANPGDTIMLANGSYGSAFTMTRNGQPGNPIVIRAANKGQVTFSGAGTLNVTGNYVYLAGLRLHNTNVRFGETENQQKAHAGQPTNGFHCRLTRCWITNSIDGSNSPVISLRYVGKCRVDHCAIGNPGGNFRRTGIRAQSIDHGGIRIDHNLFFNSPQVSGSEYEAIWPGPIFTNQPCRNTGFTIDHNVFSNWRGDNEIIANKTSHTYITKNTLRDNSRDIQIRLGQFCVIKNNTLNNSSRIIPYGDNNLVIANQMNGSANILLRGGNLTPAEMCATSAASVYGENLDTIIFGNKGGTITLGVTGSSTFTKPPRRIKLGENTSSLNLVAHIDTNFNFNYTGPVGAPVALGVADVGPDAP